VAPLTTHRFALTDGRTPPTPSSQEGDFFIFAAFRRAWQDGAGSFDQEHYMRNPSSPVRIATVSGPSGAGKSSDIRAVLALKPDWRLVPSVTTRAPRAKDLPGEYEQAAPEAFAAAEARGAFAWTFEGYGHRYGTRLEDIRSAAADRDTVSLLPITPESVRVLRKILPRPDEALHLYCCAPAASELRARHERRRTRGDRVTDQEIASRIEECRGWDSEAYASGIPYLFLPGDVSIAEAAERIVNLIRHLGGRA
jgi:guanylate kinase